MTALETLLALWGALSLFAVLVFALLAYSMKSGQQWDDDIAHNPYPVGWQRRDVTVIPRAFDWSRDEVTL